MRWVLTVPAIWKQPAKQFMREAAYLVRTRRQRGGCCSGGPQGWPHISPHSPTARGTRDALWEDLQPLPAGYFGGLLPQGREVAAGTED